MMSELLNRFLFYNFLYNQQKVTEPAEGIGIHLLINTVKDTIYDLSCRICCCFGCADFLS